METPRQLKEVKDLQILLAALDSIDEAVIVINSDHKVLFYNKPAEHIFQYSKNEVIGNDISTIMSPSCAKDHKAAVKRYLELSHDIKESKHTEVVAVRKDGSPFPADISFFVTKANGEYIFTAIVKDLTVPREMEERINLYEDLAGLGRIVAEIIHELKSPLIAIGGFARQLRDHLKDEKDRYKVDIIIEEVQRLENMIKELREYHLPKQEHSFLFNLNDLMIDVVELFRERFLKNAVRFLYQIPLDPLYIHGRREKLKQVFINIIQNALEATPEGGSVSLVMERANGKVAIMVEDSGCGMETWQIQKAFKPFYTTKPKGTGLGLSLSKQILEEHKGTIEITSEKGRGSKVLVLLPLASA